MVIWLLALIATVHVCSSDSSSNGLYSIVYDDSDLSMSSGTLTKGSTFRLRNLMNVTMWIPLKFPIDQDTAHRQLPPGESVPYVCDGWGEWLLFAQPQEGYRKYKKFV